MKILSEIAEILKENLEELSPIIKQLIQTLPDDWKYHVQIFFNVFTFLIFFVLLVVSVGKIYQFTKNTLNTIFEWVDIFVSAVDTALRAILTVRISIIVHLLFNINFYQDLLYWCSATDKEALDRLELVTSNEERILPKHFQKIMGLLVLLAALWAFAGFCFALNYVVNDSNTFMMYLVVGLALLYSLFILSFDRSIAGSKNITVVSDIPSLLKNLYHPAVLSRFVIAYLAAGFVALPITIFFFKPSITDALIKNNKTEIEVIVTAIKEKTSSINKIEDSTECKKRNEQIEELKLQLKEEGNRCDPTGRICRDVKWTEKQKNLQTNIDEYSNTCGEKRIPKLKETQQVAFVYKELNILNEELVKLKNPVIDVQSGQKGLNLVQESYSGFVSAPFF